MGEIAEPFSYLLGNPVRVVFKNHSFVTTLHSIELAKVTTAPLVAERRINEKGKYTTPPMIQFNCGDGDVLLFVLEDIVRVSLGFFGLALVIQDFGSVRFEEVDNASGS